GFFFTSNDHEPLFARSKDQYDSAQPCGNSIAIRDLGALGSRTRDARYTDLATGSLKTFAAQLKSAPTNLTAMVEALALSLDDKGPAPEAIALGLAGAPQEGGKKSDAMVKTTAEAAPADAAGKQVITITMSIEPGWHIYANPVGQEDLESVQTDVKLEPKSQLDEVKVEY